MLAAWWRRRSMTWLAHAAAHRAPTARRHQQTRAKTRGAPLKKPGAYDTSKYYQEKDEGFGDVGVGQVCALQVTKAEHCCETGRRGALVIG